VKTLSKEIMISNNVIPKAWHSPSHLLARKALAKCITHLIMVLILLLSILLLILLILAKTTKCISAIS
jgi:hypothetical protein